MVATLGKHEAEQHYWLFRGWPFSPTKRGKKLGQMGSARAATNDPFFTLQLTAWNASSVSQSCWRCIWLNVEFIPRLLPHTSVDITMANYQLSFLRHSCNGVFWKVQLLLEPSLHSCRSPTTALGSKIINEVFMHVGYAPGIKRNGNMAYIVCILETKPLLLQSLANISQSAFYSFTISKSYSFNVLTTFHQNSHSSLLYRER